MRRNFPLPGKRHSLGQKKATAVSPVTNAFGNTCAPGQPSGIERVLQQQGHVKLLRAKLRRQPFAARKSRVRACRIVRDKLIANLLIAVNIRDVGPCHNRDLCVSKTFAHRPQRRQGHNGVPHPVRSANKNPHAAAPAPVASVCSRIFRKSISGATARSITAT